jgi:hypothetical protein
MSAKSLFRRAESIERASRRSNPKGYAKSGADPIAGGVATVRFVMSKGIDLATTTSPRRKRRRSRRRKG